MRLVPVELDDPVVGHAPAAQVLADARAARRTASSGWPPARRWWRCRGGRSGRARSAPRRAAAGRAAASAPGGCAAGRSSRDGETRSLHTGSVSTQRPSISSSTVAWPSQVAARSLGRLRQVGRTTAPVGAACPCGPWWRTPRPCPAAAPLRRRGRGQPVVEQAVAELRRAGVVEATVAGAQRAAQAPGGGEQRGQHRGGREADAEQRKSRARHAHQSVPRAPEQLAGQAHHQPARPAPAAAVDQHLPTARGLHDPELRAGARPGAPR